MNIGNMVTEGLRRNGLSVSDWNLRDMAIGMLDEIIQQHWPKFRKFTKSSFYIMTSGGVEEYALHKLAGDIIKNTMMGSDPVRHLSFQPSHEFFYQHQNSLEDGDPYWYRDGEYFGCEVQPSASSVITFTSSLANYTTGTVSVIYGSNRVVITTGSVTLDMLGRWFRVGTDAKRYKIVTIESSSVFYIGEPYESTTSATASYAIGDVQQKGIVSGFLDSGVVIEEEVQLNGATGVSTTNSFASIIRISKSDKTHGSIKATSNGAGVTNGILDPGETESDWRTIKLYPVPDRQERINYESYGRHPHLYKPTDSPLFPNQFHPFLQLELFIRLRAEWTEKEVSRETLDRRDSMYQAMVTWDNSMDEWDFQQETEGYSEERRGSNLPNNFPNE